ncbi:MAG: hypothetical protein K0R17_1977 [Rariglobus sp.]|jgi:hypothetical protein|nr:hypothetical protein [Rariglobus sp.]
MAYSDEPVLVPPARRWSPKVIGLTTLVLLLVGGILSIPLYQKNLDHEAHDVRRGHHQGALYEITIEGRPHTLELGWIAPAFSAVLSPAPAPDAVLEVSADFGRETLSWNVGENRFGPGTTRIDPHAHHKVKLTLRQGGAVVWRDSLWLYGLHDTHGHSH